MSYKKIILFVCLQFVLASTLFAATLVVTNCEDDSNPGSLRYALSTLSAGDEVTFNITLEGSGYATPEGSGLVSNEASGDNKWFRIMIDSDLPTITVDNVSIQGSTQAQEANNTLGPKIEIRGISRSSQNALALTSANCSIEGLTINWVNQALSLTGSGAQNNSIRNCYIGVTSSGEARKWVGDGIIINNNASNNIIGDGTETGRNIIGGATGYGIQIDTSNNNQIIGNYVGVDRTGTNSVGGISSYSGILLDNNSSYNQIGSTNVGDRNIISGNYGHGIIIEDGCSHNTVQNNYIGTDKTGLLSVRNVGGGIQITGNTSYNIIGGSTTADRNIISGNGNNSAIYIGHSFSDEIKGNYIGLDATGLATVENNSYGAIDIRDSSYIKIGGAIVGERNIIIAKAGSYDGISLSNTSSCEIKNNYIGTDKNGTIALSNGSGITIAYDSFLNTVGGDNPTDRNIISGNEVQGISIYDANYNTIKGNYIGLDATGNNAVGNGEGQTNPGISLWGASFNTVENNIISANYGYGISFYESNSCEVKTNYIGLNASGNSALGNGSGGVKLHYANNNTFEGNVISGNGIIEDTWSAGFWMQSANNNYFVDNYIGTDTTGTQAIANEGDGITISYSANNIITGNIIEANEDYGIALYEGSMTNEVTNNHIGTDLPGTSQLGNGLDGIYLHSSTYTNTIGPNNVIAHNGANGIHYIDSGGDTTITQNSLYQNTEKGIYIAGTYGSDFTDSPVITTMTAAGANILISGTANDQESIEVFQTETPIEESAGEGKTYLDTTICSGSDWQLTVSGITVHTTICATATDTKGNTSEFSNNYPSGTPASTTTTIPGSTTTITTTTTTTTTSTTTTTTTTTTTVNRDGSFTVSLVVHNNKLIKIRFVTFDYNQDIRNVYFYSANGRAINGQVELEEISSSSSGSAYSAETEATFIPYRPLARGPYFVIAKTNNAVRKVMFMVTD